MTFSKLKEIKASIKNMAKGKLSRPRGVPSQGWKPPEHVMYSLSKASPSASTLFSSEITTLSSVCLDAYCLTEHARECAHL